jgi:hypothetical protein
MADKKLVGHNVPPPHQMPPGVSASATTQKATKQKASGMGSHQGHADRGHSMSKKGHRGVRPSGAV